MSSIIGKVKSVDGVFNLKGVDGSENKVAQGDDVFEQQTIVGDKANTSQNSIIITIQNGSDIVISGQEKQLFDTSLLEKEFALQDTVTEQDSIITLLEKSGDIKNIEDLETAAGEAVAVESTQGRGAEFLETTYTLSNINADLRERSFGENQTNLEIDINEDIRRLGINSPLVLNVTPVATLTEDSVAAGTVVATSVASDEDGGAITFTIDDTTNYVINPTTGEVTLTSTGAAVVNSGANLPDFNVTATSTNSTATTAVNPADTTTVNDALVLNVTPVATLTEDSVTAGTVVATSVASDEDGGAITFTIDDTTNYVINPTTGEVTLTSTGAAVVNSGANLPDFNVTATSTNSTATTAVNPADTTTVNDALVLNVTPVATLTEDSVTAGTVVATSVASDEDGGAITFTIDDTTNYVINPTTGEVTLTSTGAAVVNSGANLPDFNVTATSTNSTATTAVNPADTTDANDTPTITITNQNSFTEDALANAVGSVVATYTTYDEEGSPVTVTLSDPTNYALDGSGNVTLTAAGLILVNSGTDLPAFTLTPNDGTINGTPANVDPSVSAVNDAPTITITATNNFTEDAPANAVGSVVATYTTYDEEGSPVTVTLSDPTNYALDGSGNVTLTAAGLILVNSGTDLPAFTLTPNDGTINGTPANVDPSVSAVNDAPTITITATNNFTEDAPANAVGSVVATYTTYDEEGSPVTVTLSDPTNYALDGSGNVTLTAAGLILVNSGTDLPAFTLTPNDGTINGTPANVDPSVSAVNDAPTITITATNNFTEDAPANAVGSVVATYTTYDEEGSLVSVTLSDTNNYALDGNGNVTLTAAGLILVNSGTDLPAFTLTPNDGTINGTPANVDPSVTPVNDVPTITITATNNFTEDAPANAVGSVVATYTTYDEEGSQVTVTLSDPTNYALDGSGNVTLTAAGLMLVNSGTDLPAFTLTPNDGTINGTPANVDPSVTAVNDAPIAYDNVDNVIISEVTTSGNVITDSYNGKVDTAGDGTTTLFGVKYDGVEYTSFDGSGNLSINAKYGDIVFNENGDYTYTYTGLDPVVTGGATISQWDDVNLYGYQGNQLFGADDLYEANSKLLLSTLASHTDQVSQNSHGIGVKDSSFIYNNSIDGNDALVLEFNTNITNVALQFNDTALFSMFPTVKWSTYDSAGNIVSNGSTSHFFSFFGTGDQSIQIQSSDFKYLVIESGGMFDHMYLYKVSYTPAVDAASISSENFIYEITDADGDKSSANLNIHINGSTITATVDSASFTEDQSSGILSAGGNLVNTLADGNTGTFNTTVTPSGNALGSLSITENGEWTYTVDNNNLQSLSKDEVHIDTFIVATADGTDSHVIRIDITGTNDAPVATDNSIITNIAAGENITIAASVLTLNDTDVDKNDTLHISNTFNALNGTVSGTDTVVFKDTASFGANAQIVNESDIFASDSETNALNNDMAHAYEVSRSKFGQVSASDAAYVTNALLPSFKWNGRIEDGNATPNTTDQDYIKVYLYAGEKIILDIDGADNGQKNIGTDNSAVDMYLKLYNASGTLLAENDDALASLGRLGSVQSAYHSNSLDSYLEYTASADGYYYIDATAWNNNSSNISYDSGDYQLWMSIEPTSASHLSSFDYTLTDGIDSDTAHVSITTVQGSVITGTSANEILIGGDGDDLLIGGGGNDTFNGGTGYDTLLTYDTIDFSKVQNIEEINLGDGTQNISLTLSDVVNITDTDNELFITGDSSDNVTLQNSDNWSQATSQTVAGFNDYTSNQDETVKLHIQDDLIITHS